MQRLVIDVDDKYTTLVIELLSNLKENIVKNIIIEKKENINLSNLKKFRELRAKSNNKITLTKKMIRELEKILEREPSLFLDHSILKRENLTAIELIKTLKKHPPHPKIIMHVLPPYSPNLNPIERVWKLANEHVRNNVVFKSFNDFKIKMHHFFNVTWSTIKDEAKTRITDNFQTLKPAF